MNSRRNFLPARNSNRNIFRALTGCQLKNRAKLKKKTILERKIYNIKITEAGAETIS